MEKILVPAHFHGPLLERVASLDVTLVPYDPDGRPLADAAGTTGFFRWWLSAERGDEIIEEQPRLRWIHSGSAGIDHILTPAFLRRTITLTNSSGVHAPSIAEWVVLAILYAEKDLGGLIDQQRQRLWEKVERRELSSLTIGIVGAGAIATAIASRLRPFGSRLISVRRSANPHPEFDAVHSVDELQEIVGKVDWLIVAVPLSSETRGLISAKVLRSMRSSARLINVARGEIVDESALDAALRSGTIAGAMLDVLEEEPPRTDHPLWDAPGLLLLPHTTWRSPQVRERQLGLFVDNLQRFVRGEELRNVVDTKRGY